jgi:octaprenyl-diphosphate synthase
MTGPKADKAGALLAQRAREIDSALEAVLAEDRDLLGEISLYSLYGGGKRLRPAVFLFAWALLGGIPGEKPLRGASVFELVHMASLIHDDIVDSSDTRRGRRAAHLEFGIPEAVLAGDYLIAKAARLCLEWQNLPALSLLTDLLGELSSGELYQLQARRDPDLSSEAYHGIIKRKTGSLLAAACESPAILLEADREAQDALRRFGESYGRSFQIADDILDYAGDPRALGKPVLKDLDEGRITLPLILAREALPKERAERLKTLAALPERTREEKAEVLALVEEGGGVALARAEAASWARDALSALELFPPSEAKDAMAALALKNADREF